MNRSLFIMNEDAIFRLAGWSSYFNAAVFLLSLVALMLFFSIGGIWGRINDSLSIFWMLSYIPLAVALYLINRSVNAPVSLVSSMIGIAAAIAFAIMQFLLVLGLVRFEQTFAAVLTMTALVGLFAMIHALLARSGQTLPAGLTWVMILYGLASMIGAVGFQIGGEQHPLAMIGLLLTAVSGLIWVIWFGRFLLGGQAAVVLAGSV
jgi:hypothetical protein